MHTPRSTSHRRTVESNEALGDRQMTSSTRDWLKIRPQRVKSTSPGQHETSAGVVGARTCGTPLDGVDLFTVRLQVVDTRVLLHTPDLKQDTDSQSTPIRWGERINAFLFSTSLVLTFRVMSSEQEASKLPVGSHLMAFTSFCKAEASQGRQQERVGTKRGVFLRWDRRAASPCVLGRS